jgi:predicted metalloenzyme YecM
METSISSKHDPQIDASVALEVRVTLRHAAAERSEVTDPIADIIGDYRAFTAQQRDRLLTCGIDISPYTLSHLAYRVPEWDQYVHVRTLLERHAVANRENVWNGRPISLIVPAEPLEVLDGKVVPLIELIPPVHQRVYKMGLEHLGVVVGDTFDAFVGTHKPVLTGQQFQGPASTPDPVYILFEDFTPCEVLSTLAAGLGRAV